MIAEMRDWAHSWDVRAFRGVARVEKTGHLRSAWRLFSKAADGPLYVMLAVGTACVVSHGGRLMGAFLIAFALELLLYRTLKKSFRRQRPFVALPDAVKWIVPPDEFSFPSGHTAGAFVMATLLSAVSMELGAVCFLFAGIVGYSRVALGVHYPGDILAGAILGLTCAYVGGWGVGLF
jgi:undecaprenyl-diphosphatase